MKLKKIKLTRTKLNHEKKKSKPNARVYFVGKKNICLFIVCEKMFISEQSLTVKPYQTIEKYKKSNKMKM